MAWKKIGTVVVDSGQVVITDPAYFRELPSYSNISKISLAKKHQIKNSKGIKISVVSETGMGDGDYPVYANMGKFKNIPEYEKRVKALLIKFENPVATKYLKKVM
jgi:hypothetical protein